MNKRTLKPAAFVLLGLFILIGLVVGTLASFEDFSVFRAGMVALDVLAFVGVLYALGESKE